jgi:hypothetical protein
MSSSVPSLQPSSIPSGGPTDTWYIWFNIEIEKLM